MRKSSLTKKIDNTIYFKIFVALLWTRGILQEYVRGALLKIPGLSAVANYVIPGVLILAFLLSYKTIADRLRGADFIFVMACILIFVFEFYAFPKNRAYFEILYQDFLLGALPFYFVGVALRGDDKELVQWMYRVSCVSILAFTFYMFFLNQMEGVTLRGGDMDSAYNLLPHVCLSFYFAMKEFNWRRLVLFLIGAVCLVMMGTRGAVLCLLIFMFVAVILTKKLRNPIVILGLVLTALLLLFFDSLTNALIDLAYTVANTFGLSTRIFDKMLSGSLMGSSGRQEIRQRITYYLSESTITGLGIYGDVLVAEGLYAHNLILELIAHYGYYIGSLFFIALVVLVWRGISYSIKTEDDNTQLVSFLLLCCSFKLMLSSSYLREPFLWIMMGYFVALIREQRCQDESQMKRTKESRYIK